MFLGTNEEILGHIQQLTSAQPADKALRIAVAFWGDSAQTVIAEGRLYRIICNLTQGGTNPAVVKALRAMPNVEIRHLSSLHAKVVIADKKAIVGSANFSTDGLGLDGVCESGWVEAAAVLDAVAVEDWFDIHWRAASEVSDEALANAERAWMHRHQHERAGSKDRLPLDGRDAVPRLSESELFKPTITGGNKIRMAARPIELIYFEEVEAETKRSVWNPAYAASLLWTKAGNRIATKIIHCPYFESPSDVLLRAEHAKTIQKIHAFITVLSTYPQVSPAVRYWAEQYLLDRRQ
ncbi:phospholipase D family protein [Cupriavidus basilensis]